MDPPTSSLPVDRPVDIWAECTPPGGRIPIDHDEDKAVDRDPFLTGQKFGMLTVLGLHARSKHGHILSCRCDCGTIKPVRKKNLLNCTADSCGCRKRARTVAEKPKITGA